MSHELWLVKETEMINITPIVGKINLKSSINQLGQQLSFSIAYNDGDYFPINPCDVGDIIVLKNNDEIYRGIIVSEQKKGRDPVQYITFDFAFYLNKSKNIYQFNDMNASSAIKEILSDFNVSVGCITSIPIVIKKIYKDKVISNIIKDILEQAQEQLNEKYRIEMRRNKLYIEKQTDLIIEGEFSLSSNLPQHDIQKSISKPSRKRTIENMKNSIKIIVGNNVIAEVKDSELVDRYGLLQEVKSVNKKDTAQAKNIANNLLDTLGKTFEENSVTLIGDDRVRSGRIIEIEEPITGMKGEYLIKDCNHSIGNGIHTMSLGLEVVE